MLLAQSSGFNWHADNLGTNPTTAGTTLTAAGSSHTKGSDTAMLAGIANDCYGMWIRFSAGSTSATVRRQLTDILIDPAAGVGGAGSSWAVSINNLYSNMPILTGTLKGCEYFFPVYLQAGTAIGARMQDVVGSSTLRCSIRVYGKPERPEACRVGHVVETIGANTANTDGVSFTPGISSAWGSYASVGTITRPCWWWQMGYGNNDTTITDNVYAFDVAANATNKLTCLHEMKYANNSSEQAWKDAFGTGLPIREIVAGETIYVRGSGTSATTDSGATAIVYAVS